MTVSRRAWRSGALVLALLLAAGCGGGGDEGGGGGSSSGGVPPVEDLTAPTAVAAPASGALVSERAGLQITFSESMDRSTLRLAGPLAGEAVSG